MVSLAIQDPYFKPEYGAELDPDYFQQRPALFFPCNEGAGNNLHDPSDDRITGTLNGGVTWAAGRPSLDGGSTTVISVQDSSVLRPVRSITIGIKFKATAISGANYTHLAFKKQSASLTSYGLWISPTGKLYFEIDDASVHSLAGATTLTAGKDYFAVATYDGMNQTVSLNGVPDGAAALSGVTIGYGAFPLKIGNGDFNLPFAGSVDLFFIMPYCIAPQQIADIYANPWGMFAPRTLRMAGRASGGLLLRRRRAAA